MPLTVADADRQLQLLAQAHLDLEQCAAPLLVPSANALPRAGAASSTSKSASLSASPALTSLHQLDTALRNVRQRAAVVERAYEEARAVVDRCMREIETEDASVAAHIVDLVRQVDAVEQQRRRLVVAVRSAALDWKRRLEAAGDRRERDELLGGLPSQAQVRNTTAGDNGSGSSTSFNSAVSGTSRTASKAAADVTTALRRTNQLMQAELERSAQTLRQIDDSSQLARRVKDEYQGGTRGALQVAHQSLTKLFQRDFTDRVLLLLSMILFAAVVLFIVRERVL